MVAVPLEQLQLLDGQDLSLVSPEELRSGSIWSIRLGSLRPVADGLLELMQHVVTGQR
jgi:8-oxo-dGTP diphosphatase